MDSSPNQIGEKSSSSTRNQAQASTQLGLESIPSQDSSKYVYLSRRGRCARFVLYTLIKLLAPVHPLAPRGCQSRTGRILAKRIPKFAGCPVVATTQQMCHGQRIDPCVAGMMDRVRAVGSGHCLCVASVLLCQLSVVKVGRWGVR